MHLPGTMMHQKSIRTLQIRHAGKPIPVLGAPCFGVFDPDTSLSDLEDQLPKQLYRYNTVCI